MKTITTAMQTLLASKVPLNRTDLFLIVLANGQSIYATSGQSPVAFGGNVYWPSTYGAWERGNAPSQVSFTPKTVEMELTVKADSSVSYPGTSTPLMQTVIAGMFDKAAVTVSTLFWPFGMTTQQGLTTYGSITTFAGEITELQQTGRSQVKFTVTSSDFLLNQNVPRNLIQSSCRHTLYDYGCTLLASNFTNANSAAIGTTTLTLVLAVATVPTWWNAYMTFAQGSVKFTSGQNAGLWGYIKTQGSATGTFPTNVSLGAPMPFLVSVADTFDLFPGCNKSLTACENQFNNLINIGATPFVPDPEIAA